MTRFNARVKFAVLAAAGAAFALSAAQAAKTSQGAFNNRCRTCHSIKPNDHRLGPSLHGIVGRKAGETEFKAYSQSMRNSDIVWDAESLDRFIENPEAVVPGNNMRPYSGITDQKERALIVEYLVSLGRG